MLKAETVELSDRRSVHAVQAGRGRDLLLLHGAVTTHHDWREGPVDRLARDYRVTIVDRPGHGLSRRPRFSGTPREQAAQIAEALDMLGVARPLIAAHSFGGLVALAFAEQYPERAAGLVLVAPIAFPEPRLLEHSLFAPRAVPLLGPVFSWVAERSGLDRTVLEMLQRAMFSPDPVPARWKASFPFDDVLDADAMVREGEDAAAMLPLSPAGSIAFGRIAAPIHVLTGSADRIVDPERQGKALARLLPESRRTEIRGAGHMLHHTHPDTLIEAIEEAAAAA
jgi:pimeloyl-ACP methyl ester carboxylesterase